MLRDVPRDDALRFLRVRRTQVRDLCRLKLGQFWFPAQDPNNTAKRRMSTDSQAYQTEPAPAEDDDGES